MSDTESNQLEFAVSRIENVAEAIGVSGEVAYHKLTVESDILTNYIFKRYDILHTQGNSWIRENLLVVMRRNGVVV